MECKLNHNHECNCCRLCEHLHKRSAVVYECTEYGTVARRLPTYETLGERQARHQRLDAILRGAFMALAGIALAAEFIFIR